MYVSVQIFVSFCSQIYPRMSTNVQDRAMVHQYWLSETVLCIPFSHDAERPPCAVSVLSSLICSPVLHCQCCICSSPLVHFLSLLLRPLPPSVTWSIPIAPFPSPFLFAFIETGSKQTRRCNITLLFHTVLALLGAEGSIANPSYKWGIIR